MFVRRPATSVSLREEISSWAGVRKIKHEQGGDEVEHAREEDLKTSKHSVQVGVEAREDFAEKTRAEEAVERLRELPDDLRNERAELSPKILALRNARRLDLRERRLSGLERRGDVGYVRGNVGLSRARALFDRR
jgi:hypothetical protein